MIPHITFTFPTLFPFTYDGLFVCPWSKEYLACSLYLESYAKIPLVTKNFLQTVVQISEMAKQMSLGQKKDGKEVEQNTEIQTKLSPRP